MIEKCARALETALREADENAFIQRHEVVNDDTGAIEKRTTVDGHFDLDKVVRAVIEALREPTEEMCAAGRAALRDGGLLPSYTDKGAYGQTPILHVLLRDNAWPAMIDSILTQPTEDTP